MNSTFKNYAEYYDIFNNNKNYIQECDYIIQLLNKYSSNNLDIYDFGSGTGIHAIELASRGFSVHGVDISSEMIEVAESKKLNLDNAIQKNLEFRVSDLRDFRGNQPRNTVLSLFHVASYQITDRDLAQFFHSALDNLKPGGLFIFDYWHLPAVINLQPQNRVKLGENSFYHGERVTTSQWIAENVVSVNFDIKVKNKLTHEETNIKEIHNMRGLDADSIMQLIPSNFVHLDSFNWLTFNQPDDRNWNAVSVFKKID